MDAYLPSYLEIITNNYPGLNVGAVGDGREYAALIPGPGVVLPSKATLDSLIGQTLRVKTWKKIQDLLGQYKQGGVLFGDKWYQTDDSSRIRLIGLVMLGANMLGGNMPPGVMWKTMDGTLVEMTSTLAAQLLRVITLRDVEIFAVAEQHNNAVAVSANVLAYNYMTGWPPIFLRRVT